VTAMADRAGAKPAATASPREGRRRDRTSPRSPVAWVAWLRPPRGRGQDFGGRGPVQQARRLLELSDIDHVIGLRDRAIRAVLVSTATRVGAWPSFI
jgi:hypothetical protein